MNYKRITVKTLSKIAIALCILIAISTLVSTFQNGVFEASGKLSEQISEIEDAIVLHEGNIESLTVQIEETKAEIPALEKAVAEAYKPVPAAEAALDAVCDNASYYYWSCTNPQVCRPLHDAVSNAKRPWNNAKNNLDDAREDISDAQDEISDAADSIAKCNAAISELKGEKAALGWSIFFLIIAMLLTIGGLGLLSAFLLDKVEEKLGAIGAAALAATSFLYILLPTATPAFSYILGIVIFAIFALLILGKMPNRIAGRVIVIIASILAFASALIYAPLTAPLFAIAMILISLALVPCVFTEYLSISKHIFYTIITLGIWHLIWMYNFTENLNKVEGVEERAPIAELLLCAFLPLYYIFWTYKTAENTEVYGDVRGKKFSISILCLALAVISPLLASVIIQDKTNIIVGKPVKEVSAPVDAPIETPVEA